MGLAPSTDSASTYITMSILRSVFRLDLPINIRTISSEVSLRGIKPLVESNKTTREASVDTLKSDLEEYFYYHSMQKERTTKSAEVMMSPNLIDATVQHATSEEMARESKKIETDDQMKEEKETETSTASISTTTSTTQSRTNKEPWFVSQWYECINGVRYSITIDTNNEDVMMLLEDFSKESLRNGEIAADSVAEMSFGLKSGESLVLKFNRWDPRTLEVLTKAMLESTGNPPASENKPENKQIYSFVYVDKFGHKISCSLDINNRKVWKKLKLMEKWALQLADPCDLFDVKIETTQGSTTTIQLDLKNTTTIRNLRALKEESLTGRSAKLVNPIRKRLKFQESLIPDLISSTESREKQKPASVKLFSPYTGTFTATFDPSDPKIMAKFRKFNEDFKTSLYQYLLTIDTDYQEVYELRLDMTNPKVVYELITMTQKYSTDVVSFDPKIILNNLVTILTPEDNSFLTLDTSKSVVYGSLFDLANREGKGAKLTLPCKGQLVDLHINVADPKVVSKIRSLAQGTIVPHKVRKVSLITLIFLNTPGGFKPISLDLADKKQVLAICRVIRENPVGKYPTYVEVVDDTGQFITVSLDLNNSTIVEYLIRISKAAWFVSINAMQSPYLTLCLPYKSRYKTIKVRLKPAIIDEMDKTLDKYYPDYTLIEIRDSRRKCSVIYIDPTMPNIISKFISITNAVEVLQPIDENVVTIFNPMSKKFIDIDVSSPESRNLLMKFEENYHLNKPLTVIKHYFLDREMFVFVNLDDQFLSEVETLALDLGHHVYVKSNINEEYVLNITDCSGTTVSLLLDLANERILKELDKLTNSEECDINTTDVYGYPIKLKIDINSSTVINKLLSLNEKIAGNFIVE